MDRRSARTKKALKGAMLTLLKKKDVSKITVSELSAMSDIGRGTFYLHFADPYDLLDKLEDEILERIMGPAEVTATQWDHDSLLAYLERIWQYIYENLETLQILTDRRHGARFMTKFKQQCIGMAQPDLHEFADACGIVYIISGTLGIFQMWMERGAPVPPDQLAETVRNLIIRPPTS